MQSLQTTLSAQLETHQQMNQLLRDLRVAVVSGQTDTIQQINQQLMAMGTTLKQLESDRMQYVTQLGFTNTPLKELIPQLPASEQANLFALREKLTATIYQVQQEKDATQAVLHNATYFARRTLGAIAQLIAPPSQSYGPKTMATVPVSHGLASAPQHPQNGSIGATNSIIERKA